MKTKGCAVLYLLVLCCKSLTERDSSFRGHLSAESELNRTRQALEHAQETFHQVCSTPEDSQDFRDRFRHAHDELSRAEDAHLRAVATHAQSVPSNTDKNQLVSHLPPQTHQDTAQDTLPRPEVQAAETPESSTHNSARRNLLSHDAPTSRGFHAAVQQRLLQTQNDLREAQRLFSLVESAGHDSVALHEQFMRAHEELIQAEHAYYDAVEDGVNVLQGMSSNGSSAPNEHGGHSSAKVKSINAPTRAVTRAKDQIHELQGVAPHDTAEIHRSTAKETSRRSIAMGAYRRARAADATEEEALRTATAAARAFDLHASQSAAPSVTRDGQTDDEAELARRALQDLHEQNVRSGVADPTRVHVPSASSESVRSQQQQRVVVEQEAAVQQGIESKHIGSNSVGGEGSVCVSTDDITCAALLLQNPLHIPADYPKQLAGTTQSKDTVDAAFHRIGSRWLASNYDRCKHRVPLGQYPIQHRCQLIRFGQEQDSAYSFCNTPVLKSDQCIVYSFGVNDQISFEVEMARRTRCQVFMFDNHSVAVNFMVHGKSPNKDRVKPQRLPTSLHWYPVMLLNYSLPATTVPLGMKQPEKWVFKDIRAVMHALQHSHLDLVKLDIEGYEYFVIDQVLALRPEQIVLELHTHTFPPPKWALHTNDSKDWIAFLERVYSHGYRLSDKRNEFYAHHDTCSNDHLCRTTTNCKNAYGEYLFVRQDRVQHARQ